MAALQRTPSPLLISALKRQMMSSPDSGAAVREFGLVAIGAKPAALRRFARGHDGEPVCGYGLQQWNPGPLLEDLRDDGLAVIVEPVEPCGTFMVVVATDPRAAADIAKLAHKPSESREDDLRLGDLLGIPRSAALAYVGDTARADDDAVACELTEAERPFAAFVIARDEPGFSEGIELARRRASAFRAAFGD